MAVVFVKNKCAFKMGDFFLKNSKGMSSANMTMRKDALAAIRVILLAIRAEGQAKHQRGVLVDDDRDSAVAIINPFVLRVVDEEVQELGVVDVAGGVLRQQCEVDKEGGGVAAAAAGEEAAHERGDLGGGALLALGTSDGHCAVVVVRLWLWLCVAGEG